MLVAVPGLTLPPRGRARLPALLSRRPPVVMLLPTLGPEAPSTPPRPPRWCLGFVFSSSHSSPDGWVCLR